MSDLSFALVDVFGTGPLLGNPVAVVLDADALSAEWMQRLAAWFHLSETTFVLRAADGTASYRVRIFDPEHELAFAGHPSLGTAHAVLERQTRFGRETFYQETPAGLQELRADALDDAVRRIAVRTPEGRLEAAEPSLWARLAKALRVPADEIGRVAIVDVGAVWTVARLSDGDAVRRLNPDMLALARLTPEFGANVEGFCLFGHGTSSDSDIEVRTFAPAYGVPEDPVCGSGNAAIAVYRKTLEPDPPASWVAAQGGSLGRDGRVHVRTDQGYVWVAGDCRTVARGAIRVG